MGARVGSGVYFNAFHSLRHVVRVAEFSPTQAMVRQKGGRVAAAFTALALVFMAAFAAWDLYGPAATTAIAAAAREGYSGSSDSLVRFGLRVFFVGIHALTTPHMVLVELLARAEAARGAIKARSVFAMASLSEGQKRV